jgi:hypothetical protein
MPACEVRVSFCVLGVLSVYHRHAFAVLMLKAVSVAAGNTYSAMGAVFARFGWHAPRSRCAVACALIDWQESMMAVFLLCGLPMDVGEAE